MRFGFAAIAIAVGLACAGTGGGGWEKPGATEVDLKRDRDECTAQAAQFLDMTGTGQRMNTPRAGTEFQNCMERRGWRRDEGR